MHRLFLPIYHFFEHHRSLMYILMVGSFVLFALFGLKVKYEEDIFALMPESSVESQLAFGSIGLKDKVYIQVESEGQREDKGELVDEFVERLSAADSSTGYIANILSRIDVETGLNAIDYVVEHLPTFVDTSAYTAFRQALEPEAAKERMKQELAMFQSLSVYTVDNNYLRKPFSNKEKTNGN